MLPKTDCPYCARQFPMTGLRNIFVHILDQHPETLTTQMYTAVTDERKVEAVQLLG